MLRKIGVVPLSRIIGNAAIRLKFGIDVLGHPTAPTPANGVIVQVPRLPGRRIPTIANLCRYAALEGTEDRGHHEQRSSGPTSGPIEFQEPH